MPGLTLNGQAISLVQILVWLIVAVVCGATAEAIMGYSHIGLLGSTGVGLVGALGGTYLARLLNLPSLLTLSVAGVDLEIVWALLGSILLVLLTSGMRARRGGYSGGYSRRRY